MYRSQKSFERAMRRTIKIVLRGEPIDDSSGRDTLEALKECVDRKYIIGYQVDRAVTGNLNFGLYHKMPYVTYAGLQFLTNRFPNMRANIAIIISIAAICVTVALELIKIASIAPPQ